MSTQWRRAGWRGEREKASSFHSSRHSVLAWVLEKLSWAWDELSQSSLTLGSIRTEKRTTEEKANQSQGLLLNWWLPWAAGDAWDTGKGLCDMGPCLAGQGWLSGVTFSWFCQSLPACPNSCIVLWVSLTAAVEMYWQKANIVSIAELRTCWVTSAQGQLPWIAVLE